MFLYALILAHFCSVLLIADNEDLSAVDTLSLSHWESAATVVADIRSQITTVTGLTASRGIAPNMMLAKVASDINKPDGQYMVKASREGVLAFVRQLPIRKVRSSTVKIKSLRVVFVRSVALGK